MARIVLPDAPSVVAGHGRAAILTVDGELLLLPAAEAAAHLRGLAPPLLVHAPATFRRLGLRGIPAFDLLELFAFALPARAAAPTPRGLALALDFEPPHGMEAAAALLPELTAALLHRLAQGRDLALNRDAAGLAARMGQAGWGWAPFVTAALGRPDAAPSSEALRVWKRLPEWEDAAPLPPPSSLPVAEAEARSRLAAMLGPHAEQRPGQADYAGAAAAAFAPRETRGDPHLVLAEAGTGTGKTLGYLAPASLWAEKNHGGVWISTFTRHLQRQIDAELSHLFPDPSDRHRRVVVRKGRENYLCLLNLEDALGPAMSRLAPASVIPLGLIARWALVTDDGDIQGGDLPGWFAELFGTATILGLADRRGECIHAACPHWRRCFVEHTIRRARIRTACRRQPCAGDDPGRVGRAGRQRRAQPLRVRRGPPRVRCGGQRVLRPALRVGNRRDAPLAARRRGRAIARPWAAAAHRGTGRGPSAAGDAAGRRSAGGARAACAGLVRPHRRGSSGTWRPGCRQTESDRGVPAADPPSGACTRRQRGRGAWGAAECDVFPAGPGVAEAAERLARALARIAEPIATLRERLLGRLDEEADDMDAATRNRIEAAGRSLNRRVLMPLSAWQNMAQALTEAPAEPGSRPGQIMFLRLARVEGGREIDVGLHRHWLDPTIPFAATLASPAHGLLVTSATLRDAGDADPEAAWESAEARVGAPHLPSPAIRATVASPFDYATQTRAFIVTDVFGGDIAQLAAAYRALFIAAGGGALGLFTAIRRLQAVHARIAPELEEAGIPLYAQHVDAMGNATLVDIFRTEEESCLLGTDAMRDGVDVPGRALRLVVFEKVPWARPDILHRERRIHLSDGDPKGYDDRIARLRLRQAFGRLIRRATDRGVFVLLDRQTPSRLLSAFPAGVAIRRVGLAEAVRRTTAFLGESLPA